MHRRHSCSLLRKLFLEEQSSHFWKIMVAADPKSWPWTPANVFLTPKCPAKTKQLHSWQDLSCYLLGMTIIYSPQCPWGSPRDHTVALGACQWVISGLRPFSHLPSQENTDPCWRRVDITIRSCFHCNCVFLSSFQVSTGSLTGPFGVLTDFWCPNRRPPILLPGAGSRLKVAMTKAATMEDIIFGFKNRQAFSF